MPATYSGRLVRLSEPQAPSLTDIALGLHRQPRFAGQTRDWWHVLGHSLFCMRIAESYWGNSSDLALAMLLHDAHEAMTGDMPTDLKQHTLVGEMQDRLDDKIFGAYFNGAGRSVTYYREGLKPAVKQIDRWALSAEAAVFYPHLKDRLEHFGVARYQDEELLFSMQRSYGWLMDPADLALGVDAPAVKEWLQQVIDRL